MKSLDQLVRGESVAYFSGYGGGPMERKIHRTTATQIVLYEKRNEGDGYESRFNKTTGRIVGGFGSYNAPYIEVLTAEHIDQAAKRVVRQRALRLRSELDSIKVTDANAQTIVDALRPLLGAIAPKEQA